MSTVRLHRDPSADDGTFGRLQIERGGKLYTWESLELPWRDNRKYVSCIPKGCYEVAFGPCSLSFTTHAYRLADVPGRDGILIHRGNWAGDTSKGLRSSVEGCILLGKRRGTIYGQAAVCDSAKAILEFESAMAKKPFRLVIL